MKFLSLLIILLASIGCQDYNANTFDRDRYGVIELTGTSCFKAAYPVIQQYCMNCHRHSQWSEYVNEQDWVTNESLVVPGDVDGSQLVFRIVNYGGTSSDMPQGAASLPPAEYEKIRTWVANFSGCP